MKSNNKDVIKRLKSAQGHLSKVIRMLEHNEYCIDVLQQSVAVQNAIKRADEEVLSNHLASCVSKTISNKQREEIVEVFKRGRR